MEVLQRQGCRTPEGASPHFLLESLDKQPARRPSRPGDYGR